MNATPIPSLSAAALIGLDLPRRVDILAPLLGRAGSALVYGPGGVGKTFFALGIAWAAAAGGSFLGWRAPRPHRVMYVDGELGVGDMRERLALFGPPPPTLRFCLPDLSHGPALDLSQVETQHRLMEDWGDPELVVLDTLSSLTGLRSGDAQRWDRLQQFLVRQRKYDRAVLLVHHANKQGEMRGSTRREDALDLVIGLRRPQDWRPADGARFEIHFDKTRRLTGLMAEPVLAELTPTGDGTARWRWAPAAHSPLERAVLLLKQGMKPPAVGKALGVSRATAYRLQHKAIQRGLLAKIALREIQR